MRNCARYPGSGVAGSTGTADRPVAAGRSGFPSEAPYTVSSSNPDERRRPSFLVNLEVCVDFCGLRRSRHGSRGRSPMIDRDEILAKADEFGINTSNVQRDYVFGWLINGLYEASTLGGEIVLKGGNALRKGYFPMTRFSGDLDFTTIGALSPDTLQEQFNTICSFAEARSGVHFLIDQNRIVSEQLIDEKKRVYKMRLYFRDFSGNADHLTLRVKVDVTEFDRLHLPVQTRRLIHPYSDAAECNAEIRVVKLEEALADKLSCLIQRSHSFDLFDFVYGVFNNNELDVNRGELVHTFLRKSVFARSPVTARDLLLGLPFEMMRGFWGEIVCPRISLFSFERAVELAKDGMAALFAPFNYGEQLAGVFFPAALRNPILQAAADETLLQMGYRGSVRLVEPYALAYKIRRSDGVGQEYFYAYDVSGGQSGPGIKSFVQDGITGLANTEIKFTPRYLIELAKAAGRESVGYFGSPFSAGGRRRSTLPRTARVRTGPVYKVQCSYCGKTFTRKTPSTRLNEHKDGYGNRRLGRAGYRVY
jgi:predicted nucleotidyltransferase component of viral defense system